MHLLRLPELVYFMFHDRVAFGGALIGIGLLYMWLGGGPLFRGESWSWWTLLLSGVAGFGSFFAWMGYGYLDLWHLAGTLVILPSFVIGLWRGWSNLRGTRHARCLLKPSVLLDFSLGNGVGRALYLFMGLGLILGGLVILSVGMTSVFVPQDLAYIGATPAELQGINERLIPLIAHDRAGFGGALMSIGIAFFLSTWCGKPTKPLRQVLALVGLSGFLTAIGVHYLIGYTDIVHLGPAWLGAMVFAAATILYRPPFGDPEKRQKIRRSTGDPPPITKGTAEDP